MTIQDANTNIKAKKALLVDALKNYRDFAAEMDQSAPGKREEATSVKRRKDLLEKLVEKHSDVLMEIDNDILILASEQDLFRSKDIRQDIQATIINFLNNSFLVLEILEAEKTGAEAPGPSSQSYFTIQKFFNSFASSKVVKEQKERFAARNLDLDGFSQKFDKSEAQKQNDKKQQRISIIMGACCITGAILVIVFLGKNNDPQIKQLVKVLIALGAGGLAAALLGTITINIRGWGLEAAGGFAVLAFVFFSDPFGTKSNFTTTVILKDKNDNAVAGSPIEKLRIRLKSGMEREGQLVPASNAYNFDRFASDELQDTVELILSSSKWVFKNNLNRTVRIKLVADQIKEQVVRDSVSLQIRGQANPTYRYAVIFVKANPGWRTTADSLGSFKIQLPDTFTADGAKVVVQANGYKPEEHSLSLNFDHELPDLKKEVVRRKPR